MERDLEGRCGTCSFFVSLREVPNDDGSTAYEEGECMLKCWPPPLKDSGTCTHHKRKGASFEGALKRKAAAGMPRRMREETLDEAEARPPLPKEIDLDMDLDEFRRVLRDVLREELGVGEVALGDRWRGGNIVLKPGKDGTQPKEIPIEAFFHKIVMLRDKLRVLEQKVNSSKGLADDEKVQLQQYITACYGSLTTFNVLFRDREDWFVGQATKE
jgi:hypothetical protein